MTGAREALETDSKKGPRGKESRLWVEDEVIEKRRGGGGGKQKSAEMDKRSGLRPKDRQGQGVGWKLAKAQHFSGHLLAVQLLLTFGLARLVGARARLRLPQTATITTRRAHLLRSPSNNPFAASRTARMLYRSLFVCLPRCTGLVAVRRRLLCLCDCGGEHALAPRPTRLLRARVLYSSISTACVTEGSPSVPELS